MHAFAQELARRLLEEQDAEYEASLAADRQREEERQAERRRQARPAGHGHGHVHVHGRPWPMTQGMHTGRHVHIAMAAGHRQCSDLHVCCTGPQRG